jgi:hypothetical protein
MNSIRKFASKVRFGDKWTLDLAETLNYVKLSF